MLSMNNVNVVFNKGTIDEKKALDEFSLQVDKGDFITIIGSNGAGKSTIFNAISGFIDVESGSISLDNEVLNNKKEHVRAQNIGRLYQDPSMGTSPNMTIEQNLALAYHDNKKRKFSYAVNKINRKFFIEELCKFDLNLENRLNTKVKYLSGGERQALTLLMSTINTPKLLLLDEHTAALDPKTQKKIMQLTEDIVKTKKITTLMITHSISDALHYGNKMLVMNKGKVLFEVNLAEKSEMTTADVMKMYSNYKLELSDSQILD